MTRRELAHRIEHSLLRPEATAAQVRTLCEEARRYGFAAVCVPPVWVARAARILAGERTRIASVIGFPHGTTLAAVKAFEAEQVLDRGAHELDLVLHVGALRGGDDAAILDEVRAVVDVAHRQPRTVVKVILETGLLSDEEKTHAARIAASAGADFVKTSTGFGPGGASVHDVALLHRAVGDRLGVKAAGGIRDLATARALLAAGATRLGCSASVAIVSELPENPEA